VSHCTCPYCEESIRVEDLYGDGESCEVECKSCGQTVVVTASVSIDYEARCREGEHSIVPVEAHPGYEKCTRCDHYAASK
jgi:hypothetical protein